MNDLVRTVDYAVAHTVIVGSSSLVRPINVTTHLVNDRLKGSALTIARDRYIKQLDSEKCNWELAIFLTVESDTPECEVITVYTTMLNISLLDLTQVRNRVMTEMVQVKDKSIESYNWVLSRGAYDLQESTDDILEWIDDMGGFNNEAKENVAMAYKLSSIISGDS